MTAEIAIINRQAIALAANSAVTIGKERVWKYSNKLFSLGPQNDIAVMIRGSGEFVGFPWETVIKTFRVERRKGSFNTVRECAEEFAEFLLDPRFKADDLNRTLHVGLLVDQIELLHKALPTYGGEIDFRKGLESFAVQQVKSLQDFEEIKSRPSYKQFGQICPLSLIRDIMKEVFKN